METIKTATYGSPVGQMILGSCGDKLCICDWSFGKLRSTHDRRICRLLDAVFAEESSEVIKDAMVQLDQYFAGQRTEFSIPIRFAGTEFQCSVWSELMRIPYGETISYAEVARRIDKPDAVRAVASAIATNPISIFVPCHRVVGSNSKLTGYAGGLEAKQHLLSLEAHVIRNMHPIYLK